MYWTTQCNKITRHCYYLINVLALALLLPCWTLTFIDCVINFAKMCSRNFKNFETAQLARLWQFGRSLAETISLHLLFKDACVCCAMHSSSDRNIFSHSISKWNILLEGTTNFPYDFKFKKQAAAFVSESENSADIQLSHMLIFFCNLKHTQPAR